VIGGDAEMVETLLLQQKIDVNLMDRTPLHWAAYFGHTHIAQVLLAQPGIALNELDSVQIFCVFTFSLDFVNFKPPLLLWVFSIFLISVC